MTKADPVKKTAAPSRVKKIIAIESSCDETAVAVVQKNSKSGTMNVLSSVISSQINIHARYGGVVPEVASRKHLENINYVISDAMRISGSWWSEIDAIAVTTGPGLIGALHVGLAAAKSLSMVHGIPLIGVNHLKGHLFALMLSDQSIKPPIVCLVASGGHTSLVYSADLKTWEVIGETVDDAIGESFDKVAKLLDLGYPGGPIIDKLASEYAGKGERFTPPMLHSRNYNFSFSGIKTAVMYHIDQQKRAGRQVDPGKIACGFQEAVVKVAVAKLIRAAKDKGALSIAITGGVSANSGLRSKLLVDAPANGLKPYFPSFDLCTDNAAMIAAAAFSDLEEGRYIDLTAEADPIKKLC